MRDEIFQEAKDLFSDAMTSSGMDDASFEIKFDSELVDEEDNYAFLLSVKINPHQTDNGPVEYKEVIFEVCKNEWDEEPYFIIGEDTEQEITYGNVFCYMYFNVAAIETGEPAQKEG